MDEGVGASGGSIGIGVLVTSNRNNIAQIPMKHSQARPLNTIFFDEGIDEELRSMMGEERRYSSWGWSGRGSMRWSKELEPAADLIDVGVVLCNLNTACNNIAQIPEKHSLNTTTFAQDFGRRTGRLGSSCHRHLAGSRESSYDDVRWWIRSLR